MRFDFMSAPIEGHLFGRSQRLSEDQDGSSRRQWLNLGTGIRAVQGILAALYERERTGKGRPVECSLLETAMPLKTAVNRMPMVTMPGAGNCT